MLLIQTMKWFGPTGESKLDADQKASLRSYEPTSYVTRLALGEALAQLRAYDDEFRAFFRITAVEHRLIGVQTIDDLSEDDLDNARIWSVEGLLANHRAIVAEESAG